MDDSSSSTGSVGGGEEDIDLNLGLDGDDDDDADDATNSDTKESSPSLGELSGGGDPVLQQGFPRGCLLSNCYLKKPKLFHGNEDLNKHLQRCMSR
ncbi:unnamed protein product, partial [Ectocarpus sp. 12 AP-2014]